MAKLTYNTKLLFANQADEQKIFDILESERLAFNEASKTQFNIKSISIVELHNQFYHNFRKSQPQIPSQIIIRSENECLSAYRSIKSNRHNITEPPTKKKLSMRLDKRVFSYKNGEFGLISLEKRVKCKPFLYPKLQNLLETYKFCDPLLFVKNKQIWMAITFNIPEIILKQTSACGIDLGIRMAAVTSEGKFYQDKKFNAEKRRLRFLKRKLQSCGTKSARKHLRKVKRKERNKNKNQSYKLSSLILGQSKADTIILENLKGLKKKKNKFQKKNKISQVPLYQLRIILTQKAPFYGKTVMCVSPVNTSKIDHQTEKMDGIRKGRRYYSKNGIVLDADQNASINIAKRSKLPVSYLTVLDGQAVVNQPIVCQSFGFKESKLLKAHESLTSPRL